MNKYMKGLLNKIIIPFFGLGLMITACSDWTELEPKYAKDLTQTDKSEEYYEALRAYKQSDHAVAFGWYGNATGIGVVPKTVWQVCLIVSTLFLFGEAGRV